MIASAVISDCKLFRYTLVREWDSTLPRLLWIMLNPSTADGLQDDATIRRCITFAIALGYGSIEVVNLFAYRATKPLDLKRAGWLVGPDNDEHILRACGRSQGVICGWGVNARGHRRSAQVLDMIHPYCTPMALDCTDDGVPKHPLYLKGDLTPQPLRTN